MQVRNEDTITLRYYDSSPVSVMGMAWAPSVINFRGVVQATDLINADGVVRVLVGDSDLTANPAQAYVTVTSASGSTVRLTLTENATSRGWFYGSVSTYTRGTDVPGRLGGAVPASIITVSYFDCTDNTQVTARVRVANTPSIVFGQVATQKSAGLPLSITVTDVNKDTTMNVDVANVVLWNGNDVETLTVTETGQSTGVFTGIIQVCCETSLCHE